jgi:WD40 repeat protein
MTNDVTKLVTGNPRTILSLDVSPDGKSLAVGQLADETSGMSLSLWSLDRAELISTVTRGDGCLAARFSPSGRLLAYSDPQDNLVLYDLQTGKRDTQAFPLTFTNWLSFAWARERLIAGGTRTQVWDAERNTIVWTLPTAPLPESPAIEPSYCALNPDGALVAASGVEPARILIYDIESGEIVKRIETGFDKARSLQFDPSGRFIAAVATTGVAGLWDLETGEALLPDILTSKADYYWCTRFHPDGQRVAFGLWSGFVEVIGIRDGIYFIDQDSPVHHGRVYDVAFTRQGTQMFTGGDDGVVLIWDID